MSPTLESIALWRMIAESVAAWAQSRGVLVEPVPDMYPSDPKLPILRNIAQNLYSIANP